jgi:hypothetical protein
MRVLNKSVPQRLWQLKYYEEETVAKARDADCTEALTRTVQGPT